MRPLLVPLSLLALLLLCPVRLYAQVVNISNNTATSVDPRIVSNGSVAYIFWADNVDGDYDLCYKFSLGGSWSDLHTINTTGSSAPSSICIDDSNFVHMLWIEGTHTLVYGSVSQSALIDSTQVFRDDNADVIFSSCMHDESTQLVHAVWDVRAGDSIYTFYALRDENGNWSDKQKIIATGSTYGGQRAQIVRDRYGNVVCVWFSPDSMAIRLLKKQGNDWIAQPALAFEPSGIGNYLVARNDDSLNIHVVSHPRQLTCPCNWLIHSMWNGAQWSQPAVVPSHVCGYSAEHNYPDIAFSSNNLPVVSWEQNCYDINLNHLGKFIGTAVRADTGWHINTGFGGSRKAQHPSITVDSSDFIHYVWQDSSDGDYDIYFLRTPLVTSVQSEPPSIPNQILLNHNYPNPFNPSTIIKFQIPRQTDGGQASTSHVTLKVFDLLGREVATLVNEEMKPGRYERVFAGGGLASGVYLYRLQAGGQAHTKKLLLLK